MKIFIIAGISLSLLFTGVVIFSLSNLKDRHKGYTADLQITENQPGNLKVGFSATPITPKIHDNWQDKDRNYKYEPKKGDTYTDGNCNGKFDPVWIAGFSNSKPANGVHDDVWARTMLIDDGKTRLAIVIIDAIGFMNDDVVDVRKMIPASAGITYTVIASTHTHEGADLLGLWGKSPFKSGINKEYLAFVKKQIVTSVLEATLNMQPARLEISQDLSSAGSMVKDTRRPEVFDSGMRMIKAVDRDNGQTLGSMVVWGNHPETLWSQNLLISSDFPHYLREGIEKGVFNENKQMKPGIGGICVYANGSVGGLMTTHPSLAIKHPFTGAELFEPTYEKTEAQGNTLSMIALNAMEKPEEIIDAAAISLVVKTIPFNIDNTLFRLAAALGVMKRGTMGWMKMRSELAVITIGPITFVTIPGEIYPELVNGPVESPIGNDFGIQPLEVPSIRDLMPGKYKFILGLANDEIGYIIPKSQWDVKPPFTYGREKAPYGEENSLGPETAGVIHQNLKELFRNLGRK